MTNHEGLTAQTPAGAPVQGEAALPIAALPPSVVEGGKSKQPPLPASAPQVGGAP